MVGGGDGGAGATDRGRWGGGVSAGGGAAVLNICIAGTRGQARRGGAGGGRHAARTGADGCGGGGAVGDLAGDAGGCVLVRWWQPPRGRRGRRGRRGCAGASARHLARDRDAARGTATASSTPPAPSAGAAPGHWGWLGCWGRQALARAPAPAPAPPPHPHAGADGRLPEQTSRWAGGRTNAPSTDDPVATPGRARDVSRTLPACPGLPAARRGQ